MTTSAVPGGSGGDDSTPYLPSRTPSPSRTFESRGGTTHGNAVDEVRASGDDRVDAPPSPLDDDAPRLPTNAPYVPAPSWAPPTGSPSVFDAKELVDSQRAAVPAPAAGDLPEPSPESTEWAEELRRHGSRKRRRDQWVTGVALALLVTGLGALLYVAFGLSDDPEAADEPSAEVARSAASAVEPEAVEPEVVDPVDDAGNDDEPTLDEAPVVTTPSSEVESLPATEVTSGGSDPAPEPSSDVTPPTSAGSLIDDLLSPTMLEVATRLPDPSGRETYLVPAAEFASADSAAYDRFVSAVAAQPRLAVDDPAWDELPTVDTDDIVVSVARDGGDVERILVVSEGLGLSADIRF